MRRDDVSDEEKKTEERVGKGSVFMFGGKSWCV